MTTLAYARKWMDGDKPKCEVVLLRDGEMFSLEISETQAISIAQELIGYVGSFLRCPPKQDAT